MYRTSFNSRKASPEELDQYRRAVVGIPQNAEVLTRDADGVTLPAVVYRWTWDMRQRQVVRIAAFYGKRTKPDINEYSPSAKSAQQSIDRYFDGIAAHASYKAQRRAAARSVDMASYTVGAILRMTGGYDMTWNRYYQVVKVKGQSVTIRRIEAAVESSDSGGWSGHERPVRDAFVEDEQEMTKRVTANGVKINGYKHATPWDGRPNYFNTLD